MPTTTFMAPSALARLLAVAGTGRRPVRLASACWSTPVRPARPPLKRAALGRVGPGVLWEFYGSTEGQFTVCSPDEWLARPGTVGRARPGRTLSVDDDGTVWCRPPDFARFRYWRDEAKTAAAWRDGAFTVGDLGRLDDEGYLFLDGRRDDLVITGGVNVYPAEVEAALAEVPGVAEVAVFGLADDRLGPAGVRRRGAAEAARVPIAEPTVVADRGRPRRPAPGRATSGPSSTWWWTALPRTATGKLQRDRHPGRSPGRPRSGPSGRHRSPRRRRTGARSP